jgi:hypothetical protein
MPTLNLSNTSKASLLTNRFMSIDRFVDEWSGARLRTGLGTQNREKEPSFHSSTTHEINERVREPSYYDVLLGDGKAFEKHAGNQQFHGS